MRTIAAIIVLVGLGHSTSACVGTAAAVLAAGMLGAGGDGGSPMKMTGPMAESEGQRTLQEALSNVDSQVSKACLKIRDASRKEPSRTEADQPSSGSACAYREVCLSGFDKPVRLLVCDEASRGADETARHAGGRHRSDWSWHGSTAIDPAEWPGARGVHTQEE